MPVSSGLGIARLGLETAAPCALTGSELVDCGAFGAAPALLLFLHILGVT